MSDDDAPPFDDAFLASLPRLELAVRRMAARGGEAGRRSPRRGGRVEFGGHRGYVPGDDLRRLDWSAFARLGRLCVKEFEERDEFELALVVDASASMVHHGKLRAAQRLAYAFAFLALGDGHRARIHLAKAGTLRSGPVVAARARLADAAEFLAGARPSGATALGASLLRLPPRGHAGRLVVVISDLWTGDDARGAAAELVRRGDDVAVLHVASERDLDLPDDVVVAVDAETGERRTLAAGAALAARRDAALRAAAWSESAARHAFAYVALDASSPVEELLRHALRDAGILR